VFLGREAHDGRLITRGDHEPDAGRHAELDPEPDEGLDLGLSAGLDVRHDTELDTELDTGLDIGHDAELDVGAPTQDLDVSYHRRK
jgi:hypothetical protein